MRRRTGKVGGTGIPQTSSLADACAFWAEPEVRSRSDRRGLRSLVRGGTVGGGSNRRSQGCYSRAFFKDPRLCWLLADPRVGCCLTCPRPRPPGPVGRARAVGKQTPLESGGRNRGPRTGCRGWGVGFADLIGKTFSFRSSKGTGGIPGLQARVARSEPTTKSPLSFPSSSPLQSLPAI